MSRGSRYRRVVLATVISALPWLISAPARANPGKPTVEFAWDGQFFLGTLPHGKEFLIAITLPEGQEFTSAHIWRAEGESCAKQPADARSVPFQPLAASTASTASIGTAAAPSATAGIAAAAATRRPENHLLIHAPALRFSTAYCFRFRAIERLTPADIDSLRQAIENLVVRMAPDNLYSAARRRDFLHRELGPLGRKRWRDDRDQLVPLLDWLARRVEDDPMFEETRQAFAEEAQARVLVADRVSKLRQLDGAGTEKAFDKQPAAVTDALTQRTALVALAEKNQLYRRDRSALDDSGDSLSPAGQALQTAARQLESQAKQARFQGCGNDKDGLPALERERTALEAEIRALDDKLEALDAELGAGANGPEARIKERDQARADLDKKRARQVELLARISSRTTLCDKLRDMEAYGRRLSRDLDRQRQRGGQRAELVRQFRDRVQTMRDVEFPIEVVYGDAPTDPTYTERAGFYISGDVGVAYPYFSAGNIGASLFVGVSFHFTAVDKDVPLNQHDSLAKRCSLVAGVTITGVRDDAATVRGVAGDQAFLGGLGCRLTDYLRVAAGGALFRQRNPNPAIDREPLRIAPYLALSVDSDVIGLIKDLLSKGR